MFPRTMNKSKLDMIQTSHPLNLSIGFKLLILLLFIKSLTEICTNYLDADEKALQGISHVCEEHGKRKCYN